MLLSGPPGTGKTLIARQLAKILNAKIKIINGPEILDKYVGESERIIRELFIEAEEDAKDPNNNTLHVFIFDEIDSIASKRTDGGDFNNKIVNQLLTKIDGVDSLNNILIIGMTNRKDILDPAILRPGRLELHIEIGLPDEKGRVDIFHIHCKKMKENGHLHEDVNIEELAKIAINYTGAEIETVVKVAASYPLKKNIDAVTLKPLSKEKPILTQQDFLAAIDETPPAFGSRSKEIEIITKTPLIRYSDSYGSIYNNIRDRLRDAYLSKSSNGKPMSILIQGNHFTGKSKMIAHIALELESFVGQIKYVNAETLLNSSVYEIFTNGKNSESFLLLLDSLEDLIDYTNINSSFNNRTLREINITLNSIIPPNKTIIIVIISSNNTLIPLLGLSSKVNFSYTLENTEYIERFKNGIC